MQIKIFIFFQIIQKNICIICQNVILYFLSASGDGGMADALDSGSSGSLSCEGSSPFLRTRTKSLIIKDFSFAQLDSRP